jgi:hypothetical protein
VSLVIKFLPARFYPIEGAIFGLPEHCPSSERSKYRALPIRKT